MVTRAQVGTVNPNPRFHGHTSHIFPLPKSPAVSLSDSNCQDAMYDEYNALIRNSTYKARLVANGRRQQYGVDYDDTFSPVVKPATIRTVLSLALSQNWPINAFINGDLFETVYMYHPPGFVDPRFPRHVCRLQRSLYGLKQAPRAWFQQFAGYTLRVGFIYIFTSTHVSFSKEVCNGASGSSNMASCNPTRTPVDTESKLGADGDLVSDPTLYHSLA
ncbi:ribonuclease H-like domain-containing protein, partial [Tanacetum coccineum]